MQPQFAGQRGQFFTLQEGSLCVLGKTHLDTSWEKYLWNRKKSHVFKAVVTSPLMGAAKTGVCRAGKTKLRTEPLESSTQGRDRTAWSLDRTLEFKKGREDNRGRPLQKAVIWREPLLWNFALGKDLACFLPIYQLGRIDYSLNWPRNYKSKW